MPDNETMNGTETTSTTERVSGRVDRLVRRDGALLGEFIRTRTAAHGLAEITKNEHGCYSDALCNMAHDELLVLVRRKNELEAGLIDALKMVDELEQRLDVPNWRDRR